MPLERFEALAAIEAKDVIRKHGFFYRNGGFSRGGSGRCLFHRGERLMHVAD